MDNARQTVDEPVLTTLKSRDIEAQVRPLMLAILEASTRGGSVFVEMDPDLPDSIFSHLTAPSEKRGADNWAELFRLVRPPVLNLLRYVFGIVDAEDQDDLFQEVMLRFYRYHRSYDSSRPLLPWLYTIARNVKRDWMAKFRLSVQPAANEPQTSCDVTLKLTLQDVLAKLPEDDRHILWLSYYEGLSDAEISKHLNIPLTTTKYYLRRAKKRAREYLTVTGKGEK
jgi:RNA polymerase sigma-70 factor (ECF subfamily)